MEPMGESLSFTIPEEFLRVLHWFMEKLQPLCDVGDPGSPEVDLYLESPRGKKLRGPDGDTRATEIVVLGFRAEGPRTPSGRRSLIGGFNDEWKPLGPVIEFLFSPRGGSTRVWARCAEGLPSVQCLFENFLKQIDAYYPMPWQEYRTKRDTQRIERIEKYLSMESGDTGRATVAAEANVLSHESDPGDAVSEAEEEPRTRGPKAGTYERVREAHRLITRQHLTRNKAFKRANTDSRTYDQWCKLATGEEPIPPYSDS